MAAFAAAVLALGAALRSLAALLELSSPAVPALAAAAFGLATAGVAVGSSPRGSPLRRWGSVAAGVLLAGATITAGLLAGGGRFPLAYAAGLVRRTVATGWAFVRGTLRVIDADVAWLVVGLEALALAAILAWLVWRRGDALWALPVGGALFAAEWLSFIDAAYGHALAFSLWIAALQAALVARRRAAGRRGEASGTALLAGFGVAGLVALAAHLAPASYPPADLGRVQAAALDRFPFLQELRGGAARPDQGFSLALTGFAPGAAELGGPIRADPTVALLGTARVTGQGGPPLPRPGDRDAAIELASRMASIATGPLYLRGTVKETYTGRGWVDAPERTGRYEPGEPFPSSIADRVPWLTVEVTIHPALQTPTLFALWQPRTVRSDTPEAPGGIQVDGDYALRADEPPGEDTA